MGFLWVLRARGMRCVRLIMMWSLRLVIYGVTLTLSLSVMLRYTYVYNAVSIFVMRYRASVNPLPHSLLTNAQYSRSVSNRYPLVTGGVIHDALP